MAIQTAVDNAVGMYFRFGETTAGGIDMLVAGDALIGQESPVVVVIPMIIARQRGRRRRVMAFFAVGGSAGQEG